MNPIILSPPKETGPQQQYIFDGEAARDNLIARVRRPANHVSARIAMLAAAAAALAALLPALCMAITGVPA